MKCTSEFTIPNATPGYKICNWPCVLQVDNFTGGSGVSTFPAWDGVFDFQDIWSGGPLWYFKDQSISTSPDSGSIPRKVSATEAPHYPAGDWQNLDDFTQLYFDGDNWWLWLSTVGVTAGPIGGETFWLGMGSSVDPANPAGTYTNDHVGDPQYITVAPSSSPCSNLDWSQVAWTSNGGNNFGTLTMNGVSIPDGSVVPCGVQAILDVKWDRLGSFITQGAIGTLNYTNQSPQCGIMTVNVLSALNVAGNPNVIRIFMTLDGVPVDAFPAGTGIRIDGLSVGIHMFNFTILKPGAIQLRSNQDINAGPPAEYVLTFSNT